MSVEQYKNRLQYHLDDLLMDAIKNGEVDAIPFLLEKGANVNAHMDAESPLMVACREHLLMDVKPYEAIIKILFERNGCHRNHHESKEITIQEIFYDTVHEATEEMMDWLMANGARINEYPEDHMTMLAVVTSGNKLEKVKILLKHGADMHIGGENSAYRIAEKHRPEIFKIFVEVQQAELDQIAGKHQPDVHTL